MIPVKVTFASGGFLTIYTEDPDLFSKSVSEMKPPEIKGIEYDRDAHVETPTLDEVRLTLNSGAVMLCMLPKGDMAKARYITDISDCDHTTTITYAKLAKDEEDLDTRLAAVKNVVNNLPDLSVRLHLHKEYIKRKRAYVAALEATIDGAMRRPNE